ncbi:MAG: hypothetical protein K0R29_2215, partial [Pseudobdellovibrio sp.]|nr:hypothetical protein [Pseudobdellovibrio sp.]
MKKIFVFTVLLVTTSVLHAAAKSFKSTHHEFKLETLAELHDVIWGFDFLDKDQMIFTERSGKMKILNLITKKVTVLSGVPKVYAEGQGGLLDVRVFEKNKIYFTYAEEQKGSLSSTVLASAEVGGSTLKNVKKLFTAAPSAETAIHYGSRIEFEGKKYLYVSSGERNERKQVQSKDTDLGKILRFTLEGPSVREMWSYGHRNPQGLAMAPDGTLWEAEMGPQGGDEINLIEKGKNYGWPDVTYGREYTGQPIGQKSKAGITEPVAHWAPSISPSAIGFYTGSIFPSWRGNLFVGTLSGQHLRRLKIENKKVTEQEELLKSEH